MPRMPQAPPAGVVRNATAEATPGRWWDVSNVRFRQGQIQPVGGNVVLTNSWVASASPPRDLLTWHDNNHIRWAVYGTDSRLYAYRFDTKVLYDITPSGVGGLDAPGALVGFGLGNYSAEDYGTARSVEDIGPQDIAATMGDRWSMDTFGQDLLVVPTQDGHLYHWSPTTPTTPAAVIATAPAQNRGVIVSDQRHVVLIGAGGDPRNVAWSDQENYNVWAPDITNLAGSKLLQTQSYALTAIKVSDGILVFTANDVHKMSYVGAPYAYGITQIAAGCGPISPRAVIGVGSFIAWPGLQTFWAYNGNVQPLKCDVQDWFFSLINRQMVGRVFGSPNPSFSELWWDWPDEGALECNRYLAVNYSDQARPWTIGMRNRTCGDPSGTMDYPILGASSYDGTNHYAELYLHEYGWTENGWPRAPAGVVYAESGAIYMGEGDRRFHITQVVLDAVSYGATAPPGAPVFGFRFFTREQAHDVSNEYDTGAYSDYHNGLVDVRVSGRSVRLRLEALRDESWAMGRPRLQIKQGGAR